MKDHFEGIWRALGAWHVYAALLLLWVAALVSLPELNFTLVALNLVALVLVTGLRLYCALLPSRSHLAHPAKTEPFVSIHVPTHNEPPELVIQTLHALKRLNYSNYEVIVLDNNTQSEDVWRPVQRECGHLGRKFTFLHLDHMSGFKAGALNICHKVSRPETAFILVVDADYCVAPDLINEALAYFSGESIGLVQFPQAYRNAGASNQGMLKEYEHYFDVYMNMANHHDCVLSTGTVSMVRRKALTVSGGWSSKTITEDCELGLRLCRNGFRGIYVSKQLGKGLMPDALQTIKTQRERWVFGNMQTLSSFLRLPLGKIKPRQYLGILAQLTAWFNFMMIPILGALSGALGLALAPSPVYQGILDTGLVSIWLYLLWTFVFFCLAFRNGKHVFRDAAAAYVVHLGMAWEGATGWLRCLCRENIMFKRTNKFPERNRSSNLGASLLFSGALAATGLVTLGLELYVQAILAWIAVPIFAAVLLLRTFAERTESIKPSRVCQAGSSNAQT